jgi:hypothetical protein
MSSAKLMLYVREPSQSRTPEPAKNTRLSSEVREPVDDDAIHDGLNVP